uniref:Uncharacterized protein n=1 Tax=Glossina austeni TaxID=7395 RepID=A0A1A9VCU3_GLOAU
MVAIRSLIESSRTLSMGSVKSFEFFSKCILGLGVLGLVEVTFGRMDTAGPKPSEAAFNNELPALFPPLTDRPPPPPLPPPLPPPPLIPMTPPCPPPLLLLPPGIPIPIFCGCVEELTCGCPCLCIPTGGIPPYRTTEIKNINLININNAKTICSEGLLYKGGPFWGPKPPGGPGGPGGDIPTGIAPGPGRKGGAIFGLGCCRGGGFAHGAGGYGFPSTTMLTFPKQHHVLAYLLQDNYCVIMYYWVGICSLDVGINFNIMFPKQHHGLARARLLLCHDVLCGGDLLSQYRNQF